MRVSPLLENNDECNFNWSHTSDRRSLLMAIKFKAMSLSLFSSNDLGQAKLFNCNQIRSHVTSELAMISSNVFLICCNKRIWFVLKMWWPLERNNIVLLKISLFTYFSSKTLNCFLTGTKLFSAIENTWHPVPEVEITNWSPSWRIQWVTWKVNARQQ